MAHQLTDLFNHSEHIPLVVDWIYNAFWADQQIHTPQSLAKLLSQATSPDAIPISLLALEGSEPVGTINLVENDDEQRPHLRPWLAALYVKPEMRGRGVGSSLVRTLQERARSMDIDEMYLGTDKPSFYLRLGATVHEQVSDAFCIMHLKSSAS